MDLIDRASALEALGEKPFNWNDTPEEQAAIREYNSAYNAIACLPAVEAVPLDKLCEWLAKNASWYATEIDGDPEEWKSILTEWMEEQDAAD